MKEEIKKITIFEKGDNVKVVCCGVNTWVFIANLVKK